MDWSFSNLMAGLVISTVGLGFIRYGKVQADIPCIGAGIALMVYPYFVSSLLWLVVIGVGLAAVPFVARRLP